MGLLDAVRAVFDANGPLSALVERFKPRTGQTEMALEVARTVESGGVLVVEAGTGVGKTFAYVVPALLSGKTILLSTATKALQDQLFRRDIPRLLSALGLPVRVALLKGRASYLCLHRMEQARGDPRTADLDALRQLARIEQWAISTRTGDLAELPSLDEGSSLIPMVTSTRENCLGAQCLRVNQCYVNTARREAMMADVVVINHHLFFADMNVRESGVAELLPSAHCVVFDEAHQLNEIGVQFLGHQLSTSQLTSVCRDLTMHGLQWARGLANWNLLALDLDRAIAELRKFGGSSQAASRRSWDLHGPQGIALDHWQAAMRGLHDALKMAYDSLGLVAQSHLELEKLQQRVEQLLEMVGSYCQPTPAGWVRWLELGTQVRLVESPLHIAATMRAQMGLDDEPIVQRRSWIFTSATLGSDAGMELFVRSCGLEGAQLMQAPSPFDYATQAAVYVPTHFPKPSDPAHAQAVAALAAQGASILRGRTLVLTTTLRAMRSIADALRAQFLPQGGLEVLVQGQASKRELVERFCGGVGPGSGGCILVASASFWEGIDIPGDALQLLIIDKLPFSPPDDPLVRARTQELEAQGENAFKKFHLPHATLALKQGVGRLIRSETDRGVLVICDVRLAQMGYGKKMLSALPTMPVIATQDQFVEALHRLTTASTMALGERPSRQ